MGKNDNTLLVRSFSLGGAAPHTMHAEDVRTARGSCLPDDRIHCKVLRGKVLAVEWAVPEEFRTMTTHRTKVEVAVADCINPSLTATTLTLGLNAAPEVVTGVQPWDTTKRQRGRCQWLDPPPGAGMPWGPHYELHTACRAADSLRIELKASDPKIRRILQPLLEPNCATAGQSRRAASASTSESSRSSKKRSAEAAGLQSMLAGMTSSQMNQILDFLGDGLGLSPCASSLDNALPPGCRWICCGCHWTDVSPCVDDNITECSVCGMVACGDCAVKGYPNCGHC